MLRREVAELREKRQTLEDSFKLVAKEKADLLENVFGLNETIVTAHGKIKVQGGYEKVLAEKAHVIKVSQQEIEHLKKLLQEQTDSHSIKETSHAGQIKELREDVLILKETIGNLEVDRDSIVLCNLVGLRKENVELQSKLSAYEQLICSSEDLNSHVDEHKRLIELLKSEKVKVESILETSVRKAEKLEEKNYELSKNLNNAIHEVKVKEEQQVLLNTYVNAIKTRTHIYFPIPDDIVDVRLAQHLNNMPDPQGLSALFLRESSGIYHFGTKRVFVKIENGKIVSNFA